MVKKKTSKKVSKKSRAKKTGSKKNNILIYGAAAALLLAVIVLAFPSGNKKADKPIPQTEVKENKVSDIKETKEVTLNIPKKKKAINQSSFNEKAIQIRFAEIDYNSDKQISVKEYLYYFKDKSAGKKKFKKLDKNGNGKISYQEYLASKR